MLKLIIQSSGSRKLRKRNIIRQDLLEHQSTTCGCGVGGGKVGEGTGMNGSVLSTTKKLSQAHQSSSCESFIKFSTNFICIPGAGGTLAAATVAALPSAATATGRCR